MVIECDGKVYDPLGGGAYVFEKDIVDFLTKKFDKKKLVISVGAQPNSSPHFGIYVNKGAYRDLPAYLINYDYMKNQYGIKGLDVINAITNDWIKNPYKLFRNYSIYYFKKEFEDYEKGNIY